MTKGKPDLQHYSQKGYDGDQLGPNTWFLTTDFTLREAEKNHYKNKAIQSSITVGGWYQIISTFISPIGASIGETSIAFSKFLSSHFDSHKMKVNDYLNFVDALTDDAAFSLKQLEKITGDTFIAHKLRSINQKREAGDVPTKSEIQMAVGAMQKVSKGSFDEEVKIMHEEAKQKIKEEALKSERAEKKAKDAEKKAKDAEKKVGKAELRVKILKTKSILIILSLTILFLNVIMDLVIFMDVFIEQTSFVIGILVFNISTTMGVPKFIHFLYKAN